MGMPTTAARRAKPPATTAEIQAAFESLQSLLERDFLAPYSNKSWVHKHVYSHAATAKTCEYYWQPGQVVVAYAAVSYAADEHLG